MKVSHKYWKIAQRLQTDQLRKSTETKWNFSDASLFHVDIGERGSRFFLGYYSEEGIKLALEKYGVYHKLKKKGFNNVRTIIDTSDPYKHRIAFYENKIKQDNLLMDLILRKQDFILKMPFQCQNNNKSYLGLGIDWLCMQNINAQFTDKRPQLPGQQYPGLGMASILVEILVIMCWRLNLAGLINVPEHYHNAILYSRIFYYLDPIIQTKLKAIQRGFEGFTLDKISWGVDWGCVIDANTNRPFDWMVHKQVVPLEKSLKSVFLGKEYIKYVRDHMHEFKFIFDETRYKEKMQRLSAKNLEKTI